MMYAIVVADAHLDDLNKELEHFLFFLYSLQKSHIHTLYILGDLFNIWLGTPKMQLNHQQPVIEAFRKLRDLGVLVKYVEGNRDYFLSPFYLNAPFAEIASEYAQAVIGKTHVYFSHGDLVNVFDRQYRLWRRFSRNRIIYTGFKCLPQSLAIRLIHHLEQKFRGTNQRNKASFPVKTCETYTRNLLQIGYDVIVLGHFHEEHHQEFLMDGQKKHLYVLPAWKDTHKYLEINDKGECSFQQYVKRET
jgi:UDP-2,3-diacylglucosamine hydrolase